MLGGDSFQGRATLVNNVHMENMTIFGRYTCKGLNLAGAVRCRLSNVFIKGFTVGLRLSAVWYGALEDVRVVSSWRGIIAYLSVTNMTYRNVSVARQGPMYNPDVSGYDGTEPIRDVTADTDWTRAIDALSAGFYNFFSMVTGFQITAEHYNVAFMSWNARDYMTSIYVEGIDQIVCCVSGPDGQNCRYSFIEIASCRDLIWARNARLTIDVMSHNYTITQEAFKNIYRALINLSGNQEYSPVLMGRLR
jgi:hypothetical protein